MSNNATEQVKGLQPKINDIKKQLLQKLDKAIPDNSSKAKDLDTATSGTTQWEDNGTTTASSNFKTKNITIKEKENIIKLLKEIAKYSHIHKLNTTNSRK